MLTVCISNATAGIIFILVFIFKLNAHCAAKQAINASKIENNKIKNSRSKQR